MIIHILKLGLASGGLSIVDPIPPWRDKAHSGLRRKTFLHTEENEQTVQTFPTDGRRVCGEPTTSRMKLLHASVAPSVVKGSTPI